MEPCVVCGQRVGTDHKCSGRGRQAHHASMVGREQVREPSMAARLGLGFKAMDGYIGESAGDRMQRYSEHQRPPWTWGCFVYHPHWQDYPPAPPAEPKERTEFTFVLLPRWRAKASRKKAG
jgi:hypothetical protein